MSSGSSTEVVVSSSSSLEWMKTTVLSIVVIGASGDLAKKKTYPSLFNLYVDSLVPPHIKIWGYARSTLSDDELRNQLRPYLLKEANAAGSKGQEVVESFLQQCVYCSGNSYGDIDAFTTLNTAIVAFEKEQANDSITSYNRLFYFAIPPSAFADAGIAVKSTSMQIATKGWTRLIVEKPFGRDLQSFEELNATLSQHFSEQHLYRIDHYLGKEMVQNLTILRFSNIWFERVWNHDNIQCVLLTFKEPFGTEGRGGYFDQYGIIRDILQNHLLQVLTLVAMEAPATLTGPNAGKAIRDAKVAVLNSIRELTIDDTFLGQYEGYADDPTITNKETTTPTFAVIRLFVNTPRWAGVPFILKAAKAVDERKAEIRIQFKDAPASDYLFQDATSPRNELVMRMQPSEAVYMKTNVKSPGFTAKPIQSELEVNYDTRFFDTSATEDHKNTSQINPDAYTRLILDVLQGNQGSFVRDDELRRAWEIFTPLLHQIDAGKIPTKPYPYKQGSRGPIEADQFVADKAGYIRNEDYGYVRPENPGNAKKVKTEVAVATTTKATIPTVPEEELCDIGLYGLAVMGQNFALNMAEHGYTVCVGNRSVEKVHFTVARAKEEGNLPLVGAESIPELVAKLKKPRKIIILVQAGKPVDSTIEQLAKYLEPEDIIVDGGNEWFPNSIRRAHELESQHKIHFIGMGISGGEEGARVGPSLMPGGSKFAYDQVAPILIKCAAQVESSGPCVGYLGPVGAGNYVKMVHNGIEYGDMQLIAEVYDVLKNILALSNEEIADIFDSWNKTELSSYLIEITSQILRKKDAVTGKGYVVDYILDKTGSKGTGKWTAEEGAEKGVAIPTIASALDARYLSTQKEERKVVSKLYPSPNLAAPADKDQVVADLHAALYASKVCSYAQGLSLIKAASEEYKWDINLSECARLWTGGCIIRALPLLDDIQKAFQRDTSLSNLVVDPIFAQKLNEKLPAWRRLVALTITYGIPSLSLSNSLGYLDSLRRETLPANLTQAQRDFFGGHTYQRIDAANEEERFHTAWTATHKDIGDVNQRTAGEHVQT